MPVNAGPEYFKAQQKYDEATTLMDKLVALQEMKTAAPKHKGTENLLRELTRKIAQVKAQIEQQKEQAKKTSGKASINVKKEGLAQVCLVGTPNTGKSTLLKNLTKAEVEVAPYPFTTKEPTVGMMPYKGSWVQLVEIPALVEGSAEGKANGIQLLSIVRNADAVIICATVPEEEALVRRELEKAHILLNESKPDVEVKHSQFAGITIAGKQFLKIPFEQVQGFLRSAGYANSEVILNEPLTSLAQLAKAIDDRLMYKKAFVFNTYQDTDYEKLREKVFEAIDMILIYTKKPGAEADLSTPMGMKHGSTVQDVANQLHKELAQNLRFVRVWGSAKFPGMRVANDYELQNGDILEIHA
ncbi:MAG TPA: TGS domain-containing protein [Candidatus Diapherotrites archaeon]|uniref:50S ribosome-binding GTPase n=1 Tax=Candidatus Iainarchaeum sp. TaxID=3101447 RepID=A0A7J4JF07_9ARCH|nr:50S ribosome-binding GTPase [Candidatus Diapherotrites archaeon]HIH15894.1 TGS domain-containing protein [Candidatus Diapherotrites archaeon]